MALPGGGGSPRGPGAHCTVFFGGHGGLEGAGGIGRRGQEPLEEVEGWGGEARGLWHWVGRHKNGARLAPKLPGCLPDQVGAGKGQRAGGCTWLHPLRGPSGARIRQGPGGSSQPAPPGPCRVPLMGCRSARRPPQPNGRGRAFRGLQLEPGCLVGRAVGGPLGRSHLHHGSPVLGFSRGVSREQGVGFVFFFLGGEGGEAQ